MSFSYDPTDLNTTTSSGRLNVVRFLVGDTDSSDQQVQNEEIAFLLSINSDGTYTTASEVSDSISAKYTRLVTTQLDGQLKLEYGGLASKYKLLANSLEDRAKKDNSSYSIVAGGYKRTDMTIGYNSPNRVQPRITRDGFRNRPYTESHVDNDGL